MNKFLTILGIVLCSTLVFSENRIINSSMFENYTVSNGLSDEKIHCVFQDSKGWIWLGCDYGVSRFDGYEFTTLDLNTPINQTLNRALVRTIYEDESGILWIGTELEGLFKYNRLKNELNQYKNKGFTHNSIWDIIQDSLGNLLLGTEGGVTYFNPKTGDVDKTFTTSNSPQLKNNWVRKIFKTKNNEWWIGTNKGIVVYDASMNHIKTFLNSNNYKERENEIWEIYQDKSSDIWVGTYLGGLFLYKNNKNYFKRITLNADNPRSVTVRTILQDDMGDMWFGTRGGLYSLNARSGKILNYQNEINNNFSLIHNSVLDLFIDKKGDLWVGTRNGLSFMNFDKQAFGYISANRNKSGTLNNSEVYVIWENKNNNIWIGTESGGINIYNSKLNKINYLTTDDGLSSNCIKALCHDNKGNILIGTYLGGLNIYNTINGEIKVFKHDESDPESISGDEIWSIINDSQGRIWVGTSKSLDLFDEEKQTFKHFGADYQIEFVSMIYETNNGNIWIYSADIEKMTLIKTNGKHQLFDIKCRAMCEDIDGNLWMASLGEGLLKLDKNGKIIEKYTTANGLNSNVLQGIININNEYLWISSNNGLSKFDIEKKEFRNYYSSDGLLNNKYNYGAFYKTQNNSLIFGGKLGVDFVYLDKINKNEYIPPIVITGFKLFNKLIQPTDSLGKILLNNYISEVNKIELNYSQNMISFNFAALNYANSNKNTYKYKLENFDKQWNDIGTSRLATYTNLDPGEYMFKVIGSNNDKIFNNKGTELQIIIEPPFWQSWWLRGITIGLLIWLLFILFQMITNREKLKQELIYERQMARKLKDVDRLKHQFFMNISHEIRTPLSLILGPLDKILSMNHENDLLKSNLELIKRNATNLKKLVSQLLDYRKIETGNLKLELKKGNLKIFIEEIIHSFDHIAQDKGIFINYKATQPSIFINFDADKVEKIINNVLSNAIKYTPSNGKINVTITQVFVDDLESESQLIPPLDTENLDFKKYIKIQIADSGIGISEGDIPKIFDRFRRIKSNTDERIQGSGIGLALTKELIKIHNGHIKVQSSLNKGSKFSVYLPMHESNSIEILDNDNGLTENELDDKRNPSTNKQMIVLVVDDNVDVRSFIKIHFEPDFKIIEGNNGKDGWNKALDIIPDLIISDVMMPIMDGNELCKKLKKDERTSHIPVIMLSALGSNENQLAGIDSGADDYLTKPFDVGLLKAKVDNILSIRKALRERYSKEMVLKPKDIILASPDEKFLKRLIALIEKHISKEDLDVEFISANLDVSRTQLYRKISALTDMTPKEFVKDIRLKRAGQLLTQDKLNISEIAYNIGFSDVSYFRKCFKEKYGMNASDYKKYSMKE